MRVVRRSHVWRWLFVAVTACAHIEAPRGGPEMRDPLTVGEVRPDSLAIVPQLREPVVFVFERRLSERGLDDAVLVSPRTSPVVVGHRGRELRVGLRGGWQPGQIYQVTVLPGIQDLWNNRFAETVTHVFSTGPEIPETRLEGAAIDRISGQPEIGIRVEAIRAADSLVYATRTDSAGGFVLARVPEGDYQVRAFRDLNRNRILDPFEARDTGEAAVVSGDAVALQFSVVMPDTTPPEVVAARLPQQLIEIEFDDYLDPEQPLTAGQVRITDPQGTLVAVRRVAVGQLEPQPNGEAADDEEVPAAPAPAAPAAPPGREPPLPPTRPRLPAQRLIVEPATPLAAETEYRVVVEGVRNVVGLVGGGEASFTTPAAPAPEAEAPAEQEEP